MEREMNMKKMDPKDYQGYVAIILGATLFLTAFLVGLVAVVDSFTGNVMRSEDIQMTVTIVVALLGTIGAYLGVSAYTDKNKKDDNDAAV